MVVAHSDSTYPSKPAQYGLKIFALVDAKTAYTFNLEPYVGTQPKGPYNFNNTAKDIVLRLIQPVEGTNRNITTDNWFTSIPLMETLQKEKKLTLVGTLKKKKKSGRYLPNFYQRKQGKRKVLFLDFSMK